MIGNKSSGSFMTNKIYESSVKIIKPKTVEKTIDLSDIEEKEISVSFDKN